MPNLAQEVAFRRSTPKKLGPAPRHSDNARDEYFRQLDFLVAAGEITVRTQDFLVAAFRAWSDRAAKDFWPSQKTIAQARQCSPRTVQRRFAEARGAEVIASAQLKGFDKESSSWFCSSNTYRALFHPAWSEKLRADRARRADARRQDRISKRAMPSSRGSSSEAQTRPAVPEFDAEAYEASREAPLSPQVLRERAQRARDILTRAKPPPA